MKVPRAIFLLAFLTFHGCDGETGSEVVLLNDEIVTTYLVAYSAIAPAYREAYEGGAGPAAIPDLKKIRSALRAAGWTWEHYQRVHGSVSNALLLYEDPVAFQTLELKPMDAPPVNQEVVERRYVEIKQARLVAREEVYDGRPPRPERVETGGETASSN